MLVLHFFSVDISDVERKALPWHWFEASKFLF
ncbi:hypothetical protein T03_667 [Trichinella britovi]|uniref:Uncharacterized protein n=1 Tax=Trichinella britovi TaxID=45882 RepID=A0A0V0Z128_TRIBR|nr:hypothetical protein T03_667 [Trichinella britovi]